jgi:hypothetical protein
MIELIEHKKVRPDNPVLIQGLPGLGLVGKIAVQYLIDQYNPPLIAKIVSDLIPLPDGSAGVRVEEEELKLASIDIYYLKREDSRRDMLLMTSEAQPVPWGQYRIAERVIKYVESLGTNLVLALGGYVPGTPNIKGVFACTNDPDLMRELESYGVKRLMGGYVTGACGIIVGIAHVHGIKSACLLGTTGGSFPDPGASKSVLMIVDKIVGGQTDFSEMDKMIEKERELMEELRRAAREVAEAETPKEETSLPYHM